MSGISNRGRFGVKRWTTQAIAVGAAVLGSAALLSCIQGPWDYTPSNPPLYRGIWAEAYVVADKPIDQVCFAKLLELDEKRTPNFAFYANAEVSIAGSFANGDQTLLLKPKALLPNCFEGDPAALPLKGRTYDLQARFVWDSAGTEVTTRLTAQATVTDSFSIQRQAVAPSIAFIGGFGAGGTFFNPADLDKLPTGIQETMLKEFPDEVQELATIVNDSAKLRIFFLGDSATQTPPKGGPLTLRLRELIKKDQRMYEEGDTSLYYISNADLNTLSHYFTSIRGRGVKGVLVSQYWDTLASRIINPFQTFFGQKPDSSSYYFPGDKRRLVFYPSAENKAKGFNILDSIGVVNTWFFTGRNRFYFYACDTNYANYLNTNTRAGESPEDNPKLVPYTNVQGGRGFFAALAVDSFDVQIKADPADETFPLQATRADYCRSEGWFEKKACIDFYHPFCESKGWKAGDCVTDAFMTCMAVNGRTDTLDGLCDYAPPKDAMDSAMKAFANDSNFIRETTYRFCIERGLTDSLEACSGAIQACEVEIGKNQCKEMLWTYCEARDWSPAVCRNASVTYCRDAKPNAPALCRSAEQLCQENPKPTSCP
jgi:hypothetical protein